MANNTALSKAEQNALSVSYEVLGAHVELDLAFVKTYLVRGRAEYVSDQEIVFFMNTCRSQGLNPLVNGEVYLIKYSKDDPAQMVVGKDAYLRRAHEHPDYLYKQDGIVVQRGGEIIQKEGCCLYPGEDLIGGWCRVYFTRNGKERSTFKEVAFNEYNKGQANWKSKPATMINKVAISQCVRDAFPKDYEGVYSEDEMIASGAIPADFTIVDSGENGTSVKQEDDAEISQDQRQAMIDLAQSTFGKKEGNAFLIELLTAQGYKSTYEVRASAYDGILKAIIDAASAKQADDVPLAESAEKDDSADNLPADTEMEPEFKGGK